MPKADESIGFRAATPKLTVHEASRAIEFYRVAFGARETLRLEEPSGRVAHAELQIGEVRILLADEAQDTGDLSPESLGGAAVQLHVAVDDADAVAERAAAAGATILIPVADQFYGERSGRFRDPFGHVWVVETRIEELSSEEVERRFRGFFEGRETS